MGAQVAVRSRVDDAAVVARRFLGDLQSLDRLYSIGGENKVTNLAHDLELGIANDCIEQVQLCFFSAPDKPESVYQYRVTAAGDLEPSPHSGRFTFDPKLEKCTFSMRVTPSNRERWEELKKSGVLAIGWVPAQELDTKELSSKPDGAYTSGDLALMRAHLTRTG